MFLKETIIEEKAMAPYSSTLAWKVPWMEEPGRLQSMGSIGVGQDWATSLSLFTFMYWRGNGNPLQYSCLETPRDPGAWWAAVCGVTRSQTQLKQLSSSGIKIRPSAETTWVGWEVCVLCRWCWKRIFLTELSLHIHGLLPGFVTLN